HVSESNSVLMGRLESTCKDYEALYLKQSAVVNAKAMCEALIGENQFFHEEVTNLTCKGEYWEINNYKSSTVILATGAYEKLLDLPYIALRGVWGHRIDIETSTKIPCNIHQYVSISASKEGSTAIGATHNVHYHPQKNEEAYDIEAGRAELLEKASQTIALEDVKIIKDYMGLRSGSNDYLPIIGPLVDVEETLKKLPNITQGEKYSRSDLCYYPNLTMINGTGGYGFVLAPYLASQLADHIVHTLSIDKRLEPARFFERWVKKTML
ncbi:MAG: FAD-dependent oxidoreductase, partial [Campylobacterota bacterium]|nr:FAD-dependent oxidoreductase [Campylobacterota bacterium]